jgi:hypothetical protein
MEFISGKIKIKNIFSHNNNWFTFYNKFKNLIRPAITENVVKILACRTPLLGSTIYSCPCCYKIKKIPHSCKSRFCTSCGKKATDEWIKKTINSLPNVAYQHITFTMPSIFWNLFRTNRELIGMIPKISANILLKICLKGKKRRHYLPGIFLAIHSYGRDQKFNVHIHASITVGGFITSGPKKYIKGRTIDHNVIKKMWRYAIINLLRQSFKNGTLKPYPAIKKHFLNLTTFNKFLNVQYKKTWNVFLQKAQEGVAITANYLGRYIKKPPLGETHIDLYDGQNVTFTYLDHYTGQKKQKTLSVFEFIAAIICHIPDKYFRMIRYYGFIANRVKKRYLVFFEKNNLHLIPTGKSYLKRIFKEFGYNPFKCICGNYYKFAGIIFARPLANLIYRHNQKATALGP